MSSQGDESARRASHPEQGPPHQDPAHPTPQATYASVDRLVTLVEEIGDLLDGSLLSLSNATQTLAKHTALLSSSDGADIHRALNDAASRLERISELVHAAMQGKSMPIGSPLLAKARPIMLKEAIEHAADVLKPMMHKSGAEIRLQLPDFVGTTPAGAMYTVILNGLQNSVESIVRRGGIGHVTVTVRREPPPRNGGYGRDSREWLTLEIIDDGEGPPATTDSARVFDLGFTTKPRGTGVGLAVARSVIQSMGGQIELFPNLDRAPVGKRGAVLRARFPAPDMSANIRLGGAA
ncbi:MAG: HAMP domain-containing histidine kinase [Planctomycetes bacterium]|nr:HAMP domain-containing histidine kinase [Planctomycetota bacterium]